MTNTKHEYKDKEQCKIHFLVDSLDTIKKELVDMTLQKIKSGHHRQNKPMILRGCSLTNYQGIVMHLYKINVLFIRF